MFSLKESWLAEYASSSGVISDSTPFGFDASVGVRTMGARTELGIGARAMLADNEPFSAAVFSELFYGSKLLDNSQRNGVTWDAGVLASLSVPLPRHEIVNLGGAQTTTLRDLIALLEEALGVRAELDLQPAQMGDMPLTSADVTRAGKLLGYAPRTPLRDGIRLFAEWIRGEGGDWV